ncbi:hypothetical protein D3C73_887010 [compost metagenome]
MTAGEGFLDQNGFAVSSSIVNDRFLVLLVQIVGDHCTIALLQRLQAAVDSFAGKTKTANLAFGLERGEGGVDLAVVENRQVITIGVHQHQVDEIGFQALQAALHGKSGMRCTEIVVRLAVGKLFTDFADDHPVLALAAQQRPEALFAAAIGRRRVDQVDTQVARQLEQPAGVVIVGNLKAIGVFDALVTAQFDRTQAQWRNQQASAAQGAMQIVQCGYAHGSSCSQAGTPIGGFGSSGNGAG